MEGEILEIQERLETITEEGTIYPTQKDGNVKLTGNHTVAGNNFSGGFIVRFLERYVFPGSLIIFISQSVIVLYKGIIVLA